MRDPHLPPHDERGPGGRGADETPGPAVGLEGAAPAEAAVRKALVDEALVSEQLRKAIEVILQSYRRFRWNELLAETEEVRNEVARRALDRLGAFDHRRTRPLPWLMGFAVNVLRERARRYVRVKQRELPQSACTEEEWRGILDRLRREPPPAAEPAGVWRALGRLGKEQQRVLRLRFVDDRPYAEIAHRLGVSEGSARARVCRALHALRHHFRDLERRENE